MLEEGGHPGFPRTGIIDAWDYVPGGDIPDIPHLTDVWRALVEYVVELRTGHKFPEITSDTQELSADMRRLILPTASLAVFGVNLAVPTARVADDKLEQFIAQEDQSRRPTFKKAETRQFLVAAQPSLSAPSGTHQRKSWP